MPTIRLENVSKLYHLGEFEHWAVQGIDLTVEQGEFLFIVGSRGAGKSTLINIMCGQLKANLGKVFLDDTDISEMKPKERDKAFRPLGDRLRESVGGGAEVLLFPPTGGG